MNTSREEKKPAEPTKYMMPVGEFLKKLEVSEDAKDSEKQEHLAFLKLAEEGKAEAKRKMSDQSRIFNGYENIIFTSDDFVQEKLSPQIEKLIFWTSQLSKEARIKLFQGEMNDILGQMKKVSKKIYEIIIDYVCQEFLDDHGLIKIEIAKNLLGVDDTSALDPKATILSARENIVGNLVYFIKNHILAKVKLTKKDAEVAEKLDKAILIYLTPEPTDEIFDYLIKNNGPNNLDKASVNVKLFFSLASTPWPLYPKEALKKVKGKNAKRDFLKPTYARYHIEVDKRQSAIELLKSRNSSIPDLKSLSEVKGATEKQKIIRDTFDPDLFQRYEEYYQFKRTLLAPANLAVGKFASNFGDRRDSSFLNQFVTERMELYLKKKQGLVVAEPEEILAAEIAGEAVAAERPVEELNEVAVASREIKAMVPAAAPTLPAEVQPQTFREGLTGLKKYVFYGGLALLTVGIIAVTGGAALPIAAAITAPLIAAGSIAGYTGIVGMASATLSNSYLGNRYKKIKSPWTKAAIVGLAATLIVGLTIVTAGAALGVFAGIGLGVAVAAIVTAHVSTGLGTAAAVGVASGVKTLAIPTVAGVAHKKLSSSATLSKTLGNNDDEPKLADNNAKEKKKTPTNNESSQTQLRTRSSSLLQNEPGNPPKEPKHAEEEQPKHADVVSTMGKKKGTS
jgi:hypothetical protein